MSGGGGTGAGGDLDRRLLAAHAADDRAALVALYGEAAERATDSDGAAFYLTHAYVFALETGSDEADRLHARLRALGCEE